MGSLHSGAPDVDTGRASSRPSGTSRRAGRGVVAAIAAVLAWAVLLGTPPVHADQGAPPVDRLGTAAALPTPPQSAPSAAPAPIPAPPTAPPAPPQSDADTTRHIYVDGQAGQPRSTAMLHVDLASLPEGATVTSLIVKLTDDPGSGSDPEDVAADTASVIACPLTADFTDGHPAQYDCSRPATPLKGARDKSGTWTFDLTAALALPGTATHGVALVPDPSGQNVFSVAYRRGNVTATAGFTPADTSPITLGDSGSGQSALVAPIPGSSSTVALPIPALAPLPPPTGPATASPAPASHSPLTPATAPPLVPVSAESLDFRRLPRWTLLFLPLALGAAAMWLDPRTLTRAAARAIVAAAGEAGRA